MENDDFFEIRWIGLVVLFALSFAAIALLFEAYVITQLWSWFVIPLFPELPTLSIPKVFVVLLVGKTVINIIVKVMKKIIKGDGEEDKKEDKLAAFRKGVNYIWIRILIPLALLLTGWIIHKTIHLPF
jgi:cytochrome b subunit of formate dehydrogenase